MTGLGLDIMAFVHIRFSTHADYALQLLAEDLDSDSGFIEQVFRCPMGMASIQSSLALRELKTSGRMAIPKPLKERAGRRLKYQN